MNRKTKGWLIAAASLILLGCIIFGGVMTMNKWNFKKLSTIEYETNRYEIAEDYRDISILCNTAEIVIVPSQNGKTAVTCYEETKVKHSVRVENGTLLIRSEDGRKWYDHIAINLGAPRIILELPQEEYSTLSVEINTGNVEISEAFCFESMDIRGNTGSVTSYASVTGQGKIKTSTGDITLKNISAGALSLTASTGKVSVTDLRCGGDVQIEVSTGKVKLENVACKNLLSGGGTGNLFLQNVIAEGKISLERSTGKVELEGCDGAELFIKTTTGTVKGSLLSSKVFVCKTSTGSVKVPQSTTGGKCEITTSTGSIIITIE